MNIVRTSSVATIALLVALGTAACEKEKGPAEKLGARIDAAASDAKAAAEKAKEDLRQAAEDVKKELDE